MTEHVTLYLKSKSPQAFDCAAHQMTPEGTLIFYDGKGRVIRAEHPNAWRHVEFKGTKGELALIQEADKAFAGNCEVISRGEVIGTYQDALADVFPDPMLQIQVPDVGHVIVREWDSLSIEYDRKSTVFDLAPENVAATFADAETEGEA